MDAPDAAKILAALQAELAESKRRIEASRPWWRRLFSGPTSRQNRLALARTQQRLIETVEMLVAALQPVEELARLRKTVAEDRSQLEAMRSDLAETRLLLDRTREEVDEHHERRRQYEFRELDPESLRLRLEQVEHLARLGLTREANAQVLFARILEQLGRESKTPPA